MNANRFQELMEEAEELPHSPTQVAIHEEAVREADRLGDEHLGFEARNALVSSAVFSGAREKAMVAYSWCLAYYDRNPEEFSWWGEYEFLWQYKWIVGQATQFPQIKREQLSELIEDMARRFSKAGYNDRTANYFRMDNAMRMGDLDEADQFADLVRKVERDDMADCEACECDNRGDMHFLRRRDKQGLKTVQPILSGRMSCSEIPHNTLAAVLIPHVRLDKAQEAIPLQQKGYRLISRNRDYLEQIAYHMLFLVHLGEENRAVRMFDRHFIWALESAVPGHRFWFYLAGAVTFEAIAERKKNRKRKLRLPTKFELYTDDDSYLPSELSAWLWKATHDLADRFNARNGNDFYSQHIAESREVGRLSP